MSNLKTHSTLDEKPPMTQDPRRLLSDSVMTPQQILVVAITVGLTAIDGFDVLSISFASPGIAREWGIDRAALGIVLSMELIGMALGSISIGSIADRIGRRYTLLGCLATMTAGMSMVSTVSSIYQLSAWRVVTGLGIGGMLATTNAVAAEFSSAKRRHLAISLMAVGYPLGAIAGGAIAGQLLVHADWCQVFVLGAVMSAALIPAIFWGVPESIGWLYERRPTRALERVNRSLQRLGYGPVSNLPELTGRQSKVPLVALFAADIRSRTLLATAAYFFHITTFYFILKWVPKIVVDMGFAPSSAAGVLVWANVGGAMGGAVLGLLTRRLGLRRLIVAFMVASTAGVSYFGHGQASLAGLSLMCALTGFCTNGGVVGVYALLAGAFPAHLRASGTGFAIGVGRAGAIFAPIIAGYLFHAGFGLQVVAVAMGIGSLLAAGCVLALPKAASASA
jgi:benzoate transport